MTIDYRIMNTTTNCTNIIQENENEYIFKAKEEEKNKQSHLMCVYNQRPEWNEIMFIYETQNFHKSLNLIYALQMRNCIEKSIELLHVYRYFVEPKNKLFLS